VKLLPNAAHAKYARNSSKTKRSFKSSHGGDLVRKCNVFPMFPTATGLYFKRLLVMSDFRISPIPQSNDETTLSQTSARQGQTGMGVRYVLVISLIAVVIGFAAAYVFFFGL
jgi:hypothetical protein